MVYCILPQGPDFLCSAKTVKVRCTPVLGSRREITMRIQQKTPPKLNVLPLADLSWVAGIWEF